MSIQALNRTDTTSGQGSIPTFRSPSRGASIRSLIHPSTREALLRRWGKGIGTDHLTVAASMLAKQVLSLLLADTLYGVTRKNQAPLFTPDSLQILFHGGWNLSIISEHPQVSSFRDGDREAWRAEALRRLFQENITPLVTSLSTYIPSPILWESARCYIDYYYEKWREETSDPAEKEQIISDFRFLTEEENDLIAGCPPNPLAKKPKALTDEGEGLTRRTCCLYHRLPDAKPCANCPTGRRGSCTV